MMVCPMDDRRLDREKLDLLHASVREADRTVGHSIELIEETERLVRWARRFDTPVLGLRLLEC